MTLRIGDAVTATSVFDSVRASISSILDAVPTSIIFTTIVNTVAGQGAHVRLLKYDGNGSFIADLGEMHDDGAQGDAVANDGVFSRQITATETGPGFVVYRSAFVPQTGCPDLSDTLILPIVVRQDPENVLDSLVLDLRTGNLPAAYQRLGSALNQKRTLDGLSSTALNALADSLAQRRLVEARDDLRIYSGPVVEGGGTRDVAFMLVRDSGGVWRVTSW
jgi:hypothetical protein